MAKKPPTPPPTSSEAAGPAGPTRASFGAKRKPPTGEIGRSGLYQFGGVIHEEWLRKLQGELGRRIYKEMADNDPTVGAIMFAVEMLIRNSDWRVDPFSDSPEHAEQAEYVASLLEDMEDTWEDTLAEILTMLVFGFATHEVVYKLRQGMEGDDETKWSKHDDGLVGWRSLAPRSQDTLDRWEFDPKTGRVVGFWQRVPDTGETVQIPLRKALVFKTTSRKANPEGRSILRNAFLPWFRKKRIEEAEAIGVERDLAGLPVFYVKPSLWDEPGQAKLGEYLRIIENLKNDEQAGLVLPAEYDDKGNQLTKFELAGTGSRRLFDTVAISGKYDRQIAQVVLADFIQLGHETVGSFALSSDKTTLFATALGAWLKAIAAVINRQELPRLYKLNGWNPAECATLVPEDVEDPEIEKFAAAMTALTGAGWLTPGNREDEAVVRERLDLPEPPEDLFDDAGMRVNPLTGEPAIPGMEPKPEPPLVVGPDGKVAPGQPAKKAPGGFPMKPGGKGAPPFGGKKKASVPGDDDEDEPFAKYSDSQPRDDEGQWTDGGGSGGDDYDEAAERTADVPARYEKYVGPARDLPPAEVKAVRAYTAGQRSNAINARLNAGTKLSARDAETAKNLDRAIARSKLPEDTTLHRAVGADKLPEDLAVGDTFTDRGFASTSLSPGVARAYADAMVDGYVYEAEPRILRIEAKAGQPALFADAVGETLVEAGFMAEHEMILPRGTSFRVTGIRGKTISVEIVGGRSRAKKRWFW